jgi:hypothetical protein
MQQVIINGASTGILFNEIDFVTQQLMLEAQDQ